jgi:hypothetical protein
LVENWPRNKKKWQTLDSPASHAHELLSQSITTAHDLQRASSRADWANSGLFWLGLPKSWCGYFVKKSGHNTKKVLKLSIHNMVFFAFRIEWNGLKIELFFEISCIELGYFGLLLNFAKKSSSRARACQHLSKFDFFFEKLVYSILLEIKKYPSFIYSILWPFLRVESHFCQSQHIKILAGSAKRGPSWPSPLDQVVER